MLLPATNLLPHCKRERGTCSSDAYFFRMSRGLLLVTAAVKLLPEGSVVRIVIVSGGTQRPSLFAFVCKVLRARWRKLGLHTASIANSVACARDRVDYGFHVRFGVADEDHIAIANNLACELNAA